MAAAHSAHFTKSPTIAVGAGASAERADAGPVIAAIDNRKAQVAEAPPYHRRQPYPPPLGYRTRTSSLTGMALVSS